MTDHILSQTSAGVMTLTLDRPEKKNALNMAMYSSLAQWLRQADADASVRVVILTGRGGFTSGNDIGDFLQSQAGIGDSPVHQFMMALFEMRKPVIAAVTGQAVGIGTTLLLHCDLVYVSRDARLQMPFVPLGLCPEFGSSVILPRLMGTARASQLLLLGEAFSGEQAAAWGLANQCLGNDEDVLQQAQSMAHRFSCLPPQAVMDSKRLVRGTDREQLREVIRVEGELFSQRLQSPEAKEALTAFTERRAPDFSRC